MRRHADGFGRPWAAVAGSGQRVRERRTGGGWRAQATQAPRHPGTSRPRSTRLLLALIMSLDGERCGVESPSRRLPFCSATNPSTMRAESPSPGAPRGVWGLTWFESQEIASSHAGRCRIYAKLLCGWAAKASRCAAASGDVVHPTLAGAL